MTGPIPGALGSLSNLTRLRVARNPLTGQLPLRLTNLAELTVFDASETNVCMPADPRFQRWRNAIEVRGTFLGRSCESHAGDLAALEAFYDATGGSNWTNSTNWKTSAPLWQWHGVETDTDGRRVTRLDLASNDLTRSDPARTGTLDQP